MGMTIDEAISDLIELKICGVVLFTKGTISGGNYKVITGDCVDEAVTILRKYQKIEQIVKAWNIMNSFDSMGQIRKVLEDGSN